MEGIRNGKSSPVHKRQKAPCFASNGSPMESMIGSGKIHIVGADVGFQSGRATEKEPIPAQAREGFKLSISAPGEEGPGDEELPSGYLAAPGTGLRRSVFGVDV